MPIYEFFCPACNLVLDFFARRPAPDAKPACPHCGGALSRAVEDFATAPRGGADASDDLGDAPVDEARAAAAAEAFADRLDALDPDDPRGAARTLREFGEASGVALDPEMRDALRRVEEGGDPEELDAALDERVDEGGDFLAPADRARRPARRAPPRKDPELHDLPLPPLPPARPNTFG